MDAYPLEYIEHNLPLVLLSGLGAQEGLENGSGQAHHRESGTRLNASSPECCGEQAGHLLGSIRNLDGTDLPWNTPDQIAPTALLRYKMKAIGRTWTLPSRKAAPVAQPTSPEGLHNHNGAHYRSGELHSPLSPLSPGSPIFPDGVITNQWFEKHQQQVPSIIISFFEISAGADASQDDLIKSDINAIRTALTRSGYKSKFAAVLLSDRGILQAPELEDRLASIRRVTSLDSKTGLFFMPPMSSRVEISTFVQTMMTALQPLCVEHYRDLTKHARRKKARGSSTASAQTQLGGASQTLSTSGWNVRYEVKQGVFAEFRQEMDVAERHYAAAIDELFNAEGIFEATPSWSPRWEGGRVLCDSLAIRLIRCRLWSSQTTRAAQLWSSYKARMKDLLDRRGKGSQTYGWHAWEARWAHVMAELVQRAALPALSLAGRPPTLSDESTSLQIYVTAEKSFATADRIPPFHSLHHPGYWLRLAARYSKARRKRALAIPDEDRVPPDQLPASALANRKSQYDTYLAPEPHEERAVGPDTTDGHRAFTNAARSAFHFRGQIRMEDFLSLELAREALEKQCPREALKLLESVLRETRWRYDDWKEILSDLLLELRRGAVAERQAATVVETTYEALSTIAVHQDAPLLDLSHCLQDMDPEESQEHLTLSYHDDERRPPIFCSFAFFDKEAHVGERVGCQLVILSNAVTDSPPLGLSNIVLLFGDSRSVRIVHELTALPEEVVNLDDLVVATAGAFEATANLTLFPAQRRVINFSLTFKDTEVIGLTEISFMITTKSFTIQHAFTNEASLRSEWLYIANGDIMEPLALKRAETTLLTVLPKPPKVEVTVHGLLKHYYIGQVAHLTVVVFNGEDEPVDGCISARLRSEQDVDLDLRLVSGSSIENAKDGLGRQVQSELETQLAVLDPKQSRSFGLLVNAPSDPSQISLELELAYAASSDSNTALRKTAVVELDVLKLFEASFNLEPLSHRDPWPSYFSFTSESANGPQGIPQLWNINCRLSSLALETITIHAVEVHFDRVVGDSQALVSPSAEQAAYELAPHETSTIALPIQTQKNSFNDRSPTTLEATLAITWSFTSDTSTEPSTTTYLAIPRLTLPVSEPRVLCTLSSQPPPFPARTKLQYHIENPSTHFLTFALTMEASEDFGFSGPKHRALSLAPVSRECVEYEIVLYEEHEGEGRWIWPALEVVDSFYQKSLRVHAGGEGVVVDGEGNVGVWVKRA